MEKTKKLHWLIIDDSKLDCFIAEKIIRNTDHCETVRSFLQATEALEYIKTAPVDKEIGTILVVDLQMPLMNGLEFAEELDRLPREITENFKMVMILSSSFKLDMDRVRPVLKNLRIKNLLQNKPFTSNSLNSLFTVM